ncbi:MAG: 6-phosphogluconolactonase [Solirubrobacteraceae bacterium]
MSLDVDIVEDPAGACAGLLIEIAGRGGHIVLAGGSTPRQAYALAATLPGAWRDCHLWFGDERCVPPDDERSNYRMVKHELIDPLAARSEHPHVDRIEGELGAEQAADRYEAELRAAGPPAFDLVLLGVGPDGHTASLFPGKPALAEQVRLAVAVPEAGLEPFVPRVTLSFTALASGKHIVFLIAGAAKAEIVERVFGKRDPGQPELPAQTLIAISENVTLLTDPAAAALL